MEAKPQSTSAEHADSNNNSSSNDHQAAAANNSSGTTFDPITHYTRLYISHLPKYLTDQRLQNLFSQYGAITDCKIKRTPNGKSREFAFVGFERHKDAKKALKALNGTYIDTRKIAVRKALPRGADQLKGQAWSNWTKGDESFKKQKEKERMQNQNHSSRIKAIKEEFFKEFDIVEKSHKDSEFREFIGLQNNNKSWKNDMFEQDDEAVNAVGNKKKRKQLASSSGAADSDDSSVTSVDSDDEEEQNKRAAASRQKASSLQSVKAMADGDANGNKKAAKMSDADFLNMIQKNDGDDASSESSSDDENETAPGTKRGAIKRRNVNVLDTGRLFLRNIGYTWTEDDLHKLFANYGEISAVHLPMDSTTKTGVGYGFVTFMFPEKAQQAMHDLNGTSYKGRVIHILPAENPKQVDLKELNERDDLSFKQKLLAKRKAEKDNKITWNALYMRGDTVAESMAQQMGVDKRKFLGDASRTDRMAVRMAKAEAEMIRQTKETLSTHGVDFSILNKPETLGMRSRNTILIKNLPPNTQTEELESLFSESGQLEKVIMPPSRTIALVKFYHNNEAKKAFNKNSFKSFKHVPLFLEWAPQALMDSANKKKQAKAAREAAKNDDGSKKEPEVVKVQAAREENAENATLFVSNISFSTTQDDIMELFATCGEVVNVRLLKSSGRGSHRGSGFVSYKSLKHAARAHEKLQNYVLDNHALVVRYSNINRGDSNDAATGGKKEKVAVVDGKTLTFKKIVVKNLAFQATKKEIYQLFSQFGKIDTVRLPEKVAGGHRGFAFVEFVSPEECHNAYEALKHAHLYGRHLVLQYAADDNSLETARKRARENIQRNEQSHERANKRQRREYNL